MSLNNPSHHRQSDALAGTNFGMQTLECHEDLLLIRLRDTQSIVFHEVNLHSWHLCLVAERADNNVSRAGVVEVSGGIDQQVAEDLIDCRRITPAGGQASNADLGVALTQRPVQR